MAQEFGYGGQAVILGVMMRGSRSLAVAVRAPDGNIVLHEEPVNAALYRGPMSKIPFVRGLTMLWDALGLGMRSLMFSANVAGYAVGVFDDLKATAQGFVEPTSRVEPRPRHHAYYRPLVDLCVSLFDSLRPTYRDLVRLPQPPEA